MNKYIKIKLEDWYSLCYIMGNYTGLIESISILKENANLESINNADSKLQDLFLNIKENLEFVSDDK